MNTTFIKSDASEDASIELQDGEGSEASLKDLEQDQIDLTRTYNTSLGKALTMFDLSTSPQR